MARKTLVKELDDAGLTGVGLLREFLSTDKFQAALDAIPIAVAHKERELAKLKDIERLLKGIIHE